MILIFKEKHLEQNIMKSGDSLYSSRSNKPKSIQKFNPGTNLFLVIILGGLYLVGDKNVRNPHYLMFYSQITFRTYKKSNMYPI